MWVSHAAIDLFEKGKRKDSDGKAKKWQSEPRRPMIDVFGQSHLLVEEHIKAELARTIVASETEVAGS